MTALPPPPDTPEPPPWGWVIIPNKLTINEMDAVKAACGMAVSDFESDPLKVGAYIAVAYARRLDPKKYPWSTAGLLTPEDFSSGWPGEEQEQDLEDAAHSAAQEHALEAGEAMPDPV